METTLLRLMAHTLTIGVLLASIASLLVAHGRPLHWRYWRWLVATLYLYLLWFALLLVSMKSVAFLPREHIVVVLSITELCAAVIGWIWWARTVRHSFEIDWQRSAAKLRG